MKTINNESGLTLVEIIMAMVVVVFIGVVIGAMIKTSRLTKQKLDTTGDIYLTGPALINMMKKDFNQLYSPHIIPNDISKSSSFFEKNAPPAQDQAGQQPNQPPQQPPAKPTPPQTPTANEEEESRFPQFHLEGTKTSLNFISTSFRRFYQNEKASVMNEVYYYLENSSDGLQQLMVKRSPIVGTELLLSKDEKAQKELVYDRIKTFQFEFCEADKLSCDTKWSSASPANENKPYPDYVKVIFTIQPENSKEEIPSFGILKAYLNLNQNLKSKNTEENLDVE